MPKRKIVDSEKLIEAVDSGTPSKELMESFGIKTSAQLKALYLDALVQRGQVRGILGRGQAGKAGEEKNIVVNKRGSLVIPRALVEEMGFKVEDEFYVRRTKSGISLRKL